ncbi:unnamed protein product [Rotaria sordida]|nr:unnamed protein product [Rotaria sordida]
MYLTIITANFAQFFFITFILFFSIFINKISASAGYCYQCNSRNPLCRIDVNAALKIDGTPCNGQCYTRINRDDGGVISRGCSWEFGFMSPQEPNTLILERNSVWIFCDKHFCNVEATTLLNTVCFQPICSFLKFPEDCRLPNADITCGRFCGNILCGSRPIRRRNRHRNHPYVLTYFIEDNIIKHKYERCRGVWLTYIILVFVLHFILLSIPYITTPVAWTLTTTIHNICSFYLFHLIKGAPWETSDQGLARRFTFWEQIDNGIQWTGTRKFLQIVPIVLFFLASFYTKYDKTHFIINMATMLLAVIPKFPIFIGVRLFDINRY